MTAVVFLKRSYHLSQNRKGFCFLPSEDLGEKALTSRTASISLSSTPSTHRRLSLSLLRELEAKEAAGLPPVPPLPPMPELPPVPYYNNYQSPIVVAGARQGGKAVLSSASKGNLLEERDEDVAALAKFETLQPEASSATKAPPTPAQTPEPKPKSHSRVPGSLPEWDEKLWHYYGNRSRVGVFGRMFYTGN